MISSATAVKRRLSENLKRVRGRIEDACARGKRNPEDIRLIAVTKYVELDVVRQLLEMGIPDLGESRAQQLNQRAGMIHESFERRTTLTGRRDTAAIRPRWHMVGHLQRNKLKLVLPWVELIHSVDSLRLAEDLHLQAKKLGRVVDILLQVNTSAERSKYGVAVGAVPHLAEHFAEWDGIRFCGLMTMAPLESPPGELRLYFERLRDVFEDLHADRKKLPGLEHLSMGMSDDFETAIECGATMVRIGSALFDGLMQKHVSDHGDEA